MAGSDEYELKIQQFAKDVLLCVFAHYCQDTEDVHNYCARVIRQSHYLLSNWGMHIIKKELITNGGRIRSRTKNFLGSRTMHDQLFQEVARALLSWRNQFTDSYEGLYVNCLYIADLALNFYSKGHKRALLLAIYIMTPLVRKAWENGFIDIYEDIMRAVSIKLVMYVFFYQDFNMPHVELRDIQSPQNYRALWLDVRAAADEFLGGDGRSVLNLFRLIFDEINSDEFNWLITQFANALPSARQNSTEIYEILALIGLLGFHCYTIEHPVSNAILTSIDAITKALIKCRRNGQLPAYFVKMKDLLICS